MGNNRIKDESKTGFFMIPNVIDELDLSVYAFRLYCHIKRRAGEEGECWENTANMAAACNMSAPMISRCKRELVDAGLIRITKVKRQGGGNDYHSITIVNVWGSKVSDITSKVSVVTSKVSDISTEVSVVALKNTPIKKTPEEEQKKTPTASHPNTIIESIYRQVTGLMTMPSTGRDEAMRIIWDIHQSKGDKTADYLRPYWGKWIQSKTREGRPYSKTGYGWLDWAAAEQPTEAKAQGRTIEDLVNSTPTVDELMAQWR